jgi:hypothetical protein|tara:strand:- start:172 stop:504 length:333 start_codon:yes stop_codon:yes gene_type:complete
MKKLLLILTLLFTFITTNAQSSVDLNPTLYGYWMNTDGEVLLIQTNNTFVRRTSTKIISTGRLEIIEDDLRVIRTDIEDEYSLGFHVRNNIFVVYKPRSEKAWLFTKIGN